MPKHNKTECSAKQTNRRKVNRRTYLGTVAGSIFANTATVGAEEADTTDAEWLEDSQKHAYEDSKFNIADTFAQDSVFYNSMPDAVQVRNGDGLQYLFANLQFESADTTRPPLSKFALVADEKRYQSDELVDRIPLFAITDANRASMGQTYHTEPMTPPESAVRLPPRYKNPTFTIGFALPSNLSAERFGLGIVSGEEVDAVWELDDEIAEQLQTSPQFETHSLKAPSKVQRGSPFGITVSVENTGQCSGTYRAVVGRRESDHKKKLSMSIPAGEEVTRTMEFELPASPRRDSNGESVVYQVLQDDALLTEREIPIGGN